MICHPLQETTQTCFGLMKNVLLCQFSVEQKMSRVEEVNRDVMATSKEFGERSGNNLRELRVLYPAMVDDLEARDLISSRRNVLTEKLTLP